MIRHSSRLTRIALLATASLPSTGVGLASLTAMLTSATSATAANECGAATGNKVICVPATYPTGVDYVTPTDLTVTLQQTPAAAVNVITGGVSLSSPFVASTSANLTLNRTLSGTASATGAVLSISNGAGAGVSVNNGNGGAVLDLSNPGVYTPGAASQDSIQGSTDGIFVNTQGPASVTLTDGSVTAFNGSAISVTATGAVNVSTGAAALTASGQKGSPKAGIFIDQTGATGAVSVTTNGSITANTFTDGDGIQIRTANGANTSNINLDLGGSFQVGGSGVRVISVSSRDVNITGESNLNVSAQNAAIFTFTDGTGGINLNVKSGAVLLGDSNNGGVGNTVELAAKAGAINVTTAAGSTLYVGSNAADPALGHAAKDVISLTTTTGAITLANGANLYNTLNAGGYGFFANGILAQSSGGAISLTNSGAVGASDSKMGLSGVLATISAGSGSLSIANSGGVWAQNFGILATNQGQGAVVIQSNGAINSGFASGISSSAQGGDTHITVGANISAINGAGVSADASGGAISLSTASGVAINASVGLQATSTGGAVAISNASTVTSARSAITSAISGGTGDLQISSSGALHAGGFGVNAINQGAGGVSVSSSAAINSTNAAAISTTAAGGPTQVSVSGNLTALNDAGVFASSGAGAILVSAAAGATINASLGLIAASGGGAVTINNAATLNVAHSGIGGLISGGAGDLSISNSGGLKTTGAVGISANVTGSGQVIVSSTGALSATNGNGVQTSSVSGATRVDVAGNIAANGDTGTAVAATSQSGALGVTVASGAQLSGNFGILAISNSGDVNIVNGGVLSVTGAGVYGKVSGGAGGVSITDTAALTSTGVKGIYAEVDGSGAVTVNAQGPISVDRGPGVTTSATTGATAITLGGNVTAVQDNALTSVSTSGSISFTTASGTQLSGVNGLFASTDSGALTINNRAAVTGAFEAINASIGAGVQDLNVANQGALASSGAAVVLLNNLGAGKINFTSTGAINAANGFGLHAIALSGDVNLTVGANVTAANQKAVLVNANSSNVALNFLAGAQVSSAGGVLVTTRTGDVAITNAGALSNINSGPNSVSGVTVLTLGSASLTNAAGGGITALGASTATATLNFVNAATETVTNSGTLTTSQTDHSGYVWYSNTTTGGASNHPVQTLNNQVGGVVDGAFASYTQGNFTFNNAGTWTTARQGSVFSLGGAGVINNSGLIQAGLSASATAASVSTALTGLSAFNNSGSVSLSNGVGGDVLYIGAPYAASGNAKLALDFNGSGAASDVLQIGGAATGATTVQLNFVGQQALLSKTPIVEAATTSSPTAFVLPNGSVHYGLGDYRINYDASVGVYYLVSTPNVAAYETLSFAEMRQNLFYKTEAAWSAHLEQARTQDASQAEVREGFQGWGQVFGASDTYSQSRSFTAMTYTSAYNLDYSQDVYGGQVGMDVTKIIEGGAAVIGLTTGYAHSESTFSSSSDKTTLNSFNIGAYAAIHSHGWYANALLKYDGGDFNIHSPYAAYGKTLNSSADGVSVEIGKRFKGDNWFLEPMLKATAVFGNLGRTGTAANLSNYAVNGVTVSFSDDTSTRFRVGARAGLNGVSALGGRLTPFVGLALVDEASGENRVSLGSGTNTLTFANRSLGAYGEARFGADLRLAHGLTLTVDGIGNFGARTSGGGARLTARFAW